MEVRRSLIEAGAQVRQPSVRLKPDEADAILDVSLDGEKRRFIVNEKRRAPFPKELTNLALVQQKLARQGNPLLVAPFISKSLGEKLIEAGWSWADEHGNFDLRAQAFRLRQRHVNKRPIPNQRTLPRGGGSFAIIRTMISSTEEYLGATTLSVDAGVSQPRASQVLAALERLRLAEKTRQGWRRDREALLDRFLAEYEGPGGSGLHFYSLDPLQTVAVHVAGAIAPGSLDTVAISADVGPDLLVPWRRPTTLIVYAKHPFDSSRLGLVEAEGAHDANVTIRVADDRSVFSSKLLKADIPGGTVPLAHSTQMLWDLLDLGGDDRIEAAEELKRWLLSNP